MQVIKKDGTTEDYNEQKIIDACNKAASRAMINLTDSDYQIICNSVWEKLVENDMDETEIYEMHNIVETVLEEYYPEVAKSYKEYRNYKKDFIHMMDKVYKKSQAIRYIGDKDNANSDSALVATKRSLIYNELSGELYKKFFLTLEEKQAMKDGYIYIHDRSSRLDTFNCDLMRIGTIMEGGFEMGNIWYNEPNYLDTAFDVMADIILSTAAQQYGGFTVPEVDKILSPYAQKSYTKYWNEYYEIISDYVSNPEQYYGEADTYATKKVQRDFEQGWQGIEYTLNSCGSSRGDYPFVTMTIGLATDKFGKMAALTLLNVHKEGQGKKGFKRPVLFPKIVFLYDKNLHGDGSKQYINGDLFNAGIECSSKTMYPDWLSLTGEGYVPEMYKKYGKVVSPMGCVHGKETVIYKYENKIYHKPIAEMWNHLSGEFMPKVQPGTYDAPHGKYLYIETPGVEIYDTKEARFVKNYQMNRNYSENWVKVTLINVASKETKIITCTNDHPFETENRGVVYAENLSVKEDEILTCDGIYRVSLVETIKHNGYSYDVTTESEHFEVSGVYSHNCRAFLSPWYERGGMEPADEDDIPVFEGRFNLGVVSLNLPMILAKSRIESKDFYEVLDYYLELIRKLHKRTYDYIGELKASVNPVAFCEGGLYGGHLKPTEKIKSILKPMTMSYGITALNELQQLYNEKSIREDGVFALEVMKHIQEYINRIKKEDDILYAIYGTPAESLCGLQVEQFRKMYGIIENVSDRPYVSNSFHCHVSENMSPIEKQDKEERFWNYFNGGKIQYCRYNLGYNKEAIKALVLRAMHKGFYEGVNLAMCYCEECGYQQVEMDVCPKCGSTKIAKIDRMNGYLGWTRVHGETRYNEAKNAEIKDRVSM